MEKMNESPKMEKTIKNAISELKERCYNLLETKNHARTILEEIRNPFGNDENLGRKERVQEEINGPMHDQLFIISERMVELSAEINEILAEIKSIIG